MTSMDSKGDIRIRSAYGVDFTDSGPVIARATRGALLKREKIEVGGETGSLSSRIKEGSERKAGTAVVVAMPVKQSFTQWIEAPFSSESKARKVFDSLLDIQLPFAVESCARCFTNVERTPDGNIEALAVGAKLDAVSDRIATLEGAGVDPMILDHEGLALWNMALAEIPCETGVSRVVAYLGSDRLVVAVGESGRFGFARNTDLQYDDEIPDQRSLGKLARRMAGVLSTENNTQRLQWIWAGPKAESDASRKAVEKSLDLEFKGDVVVVEEPGSFLARALALRALGKLGGDVNCRSGSLLHPAVFASRRRKACSLAASFLVAGILLCGGNAAWDAIIDGSRQRAQERLQSRAREVADMVQVPKGKELEEVKRKIDSRKSRVERLLRMFRQSSGAKSIEVLQLVSQSRIYLDKMAVEEGSLDLKGTAADRDSPELLAEACGELGYDVELQRNEPGADERVHFEIEGQTNEE